jgi:hypothetical protein
VESDLRRLFGPVVPDIAEPVAAGLFEPNVNLWGRPTFSGLLVMVDWLRMQKAIRVEGGLAAKSIIVVTALDVYAFDGSLLRLGRAPRQLRCWRRADVVGRAVPYAGARAPAWPDSYRPLPGLRLETRAGTRLAVVKPVEWDDGVARVFEELTGGKGAR